MTVHPPSTCCTSRAATPCQHFRAQALLPRLQAVSPRITGVAARFVHLGLAATRRSTAPTPTQLAALLRYGDPYAGAGRRRADRRDAAPGHRVALGLQGHRHRAQLRPARSSRVERVTEYRLTLKTRPARRQPSRSTPTSCAGRGRAAARPHDRKRAARRAKTPRTCSTSCRRSRWRTSTCWAAAARRW